MTERRNYGSIVAVVNNKGGVGKTTSTLAVNNNRDAANWYEEVLRRNPNHRERQEIMTLIRDLRR